jgi:two-component system, sensor histidine kinase and response regulator
MTIHFRIGFPPIRFLMLIAILIFVNNQISFAQQSNSIPVEVKKTIDDFVLKGNESENSSDYNQASFYYHQAGNTYWTHGCLTEAIELFKKSLSMSERLSNLNGIAVLNTKIGLLYTETKNFESSLIFFSKGLDIARKMNRKLDVVSSLLNVANSYNELERYNESIPFLSEAENHAKDLNDTKLLRNCYSLMTRVYDKVGDREKSTLYFNLFAALTKKIQQEEISSKENEARLMVDRANSKVLEVESVKEAKEQELKEKNEELLEKNINLSKVEQISKEQQMKIDLLSKEKELQKAEIRQQHLMRNVYVGVIFTVLMVTGLALFGYRKFKKANVLLNIKNSEISYQKDEIEKQASDLRELNALKDKLFSIISHDLRSPLVSLISMLNMAKDGHFSVEEEKLILSELSKNVVYNTELLENLLKWASSQMKGSAIKPITFDIHEIASNKIKLYEKAAHLKGIELINSTEINTEVVADKDMIELVLRNLITNAIKFSNNGNKVTISSVNDNETVEICVTDNGVGMPQETLKKLFGKHVFSTRGTLDEKGTGLGLILCRDFIQINGGQIWVESQENFGSKFFFTLPVNKS